MGTQKPKECLGRLSLAVIRNLLRWTSDFFTRLALDAGKPMDDEDKPPRGSMMLDLLVGEVVCFEERCGFATQLIDQARQVCGRQLLCANFKEEIRRVKWGVGSAECGI